MAHKPVLLQEALQQLSIKPNGIYIDATFGRGGHSKAILEQLGPEGRLIAIDQDPDAIASAKQNPEFNDPRFSLVHSSFTMLQALISDQGLKGEIDGVLIDLGVSSPQLDNAERGFSFIKDGPLDMRMDPSCGESIASWLEYAEVSDIARVLKEYGEERFAKRIAGAIVKAREQTPITRTLQLAEIVKTANPRWERHKHPATRSFQGLRIFINDELGALDAVLQQSLQVLKKTGRLVVISFHSLEDRRVKRFIQQQEQSDIPSKVPLREDEIPRFLRRVGKAIKPSEQELLDNPRARSAVLRTAEKLV